MGEIAGHPLMPVLRSAYAAFRAGDTPGALDQLAPALGAEAATQPGVVPGVVWGLAGDCYFRLGEPDRGFAAYRRAIDLDPAAGCLAFFARQVAAHRRVADARFALRCLDAARVADRAALRRHPLHNLRHSDPPDTHNNQFAELPCVRWRLRRMAARASGPDTESGAAPDTGPHQRS